MPPGCLAPQGSPEWLYRPWRECTSTDVPEHSTCLPITCASVFFGNAEYIRITHSAHCFVRSCKSISPSALSALILPPHPFKTMFSASLLLLEPLAGLSNTHTPDLVHSRDRHPSQRQNAGRSRICCRAPTSILRVSNTVAAGYGNIFTSAAFPGILRCRPPENGTLLAILPLL